MKRSAAFEFAAVENGFPSKANAEESDIACEDDREESGVPSEFSRVEICLLKKCRPTEIDIPGEDSGSEICNAPEDEILEICLRENETLEIQIERSG